MLMQIFFFFFFFFVTTAKDGIMLIMVGQITAKCVTTKDGTVEGYRHNVCLFKLGFRVVIGKYPRYTNCIPILLPFVYSVNSLYKGLLLSIINTILFSYNTLLA
ncbi:hypothetical protein RchiOBHm_Chr5g0066511 [Rosa chinensis]|uniref:Secreted protein n=1 Tax=Rosa chinensis TaxID=74649 RepID=A0A2P6QJ82_ROSCH|nr:hypothetical protein RchiOBHm_Chr5g0066511 [Rosa chinensis]